MQDLCRPHTSYAHAQLTAPQNVTDHTYLCDMMCYQCELKDSGMDIHTDSEMEQAFMLTWNWASYAGVVGDESNVCHT